MHALDLALSVLFLVSVEAKKIPHFLESCQSVFLHALDMVLSQTFSASAEPQTGPRLQEEREQELEVQCETATRFRQNVLSKRPLPCFWCECALLVSMSRSLTVKMRNLFLACCLIVRASVEAIVALPRLLGLMMLCRESLVALQRMNASLALCSLDLPTSFLSLRLAWERPGFGGTLASRMKSKEHQPPAAL